MQFYSYTVTYIHISHHISLSLSVILSCTWHITHLLSSISQLHGISSDSTSLGAEMSPDCQETSDPPGSKELPAAARVRCGFSDNSSADSQGVQYSHGWSLRSCSMEMRCGSVHLYCITLRLWIDSRQREREREKERERERGGEGEIWRDMER